jgi:TolB-like protein
LQGSADASYRRPCGSLLHCRFASCPDRPPDVAVIAHPRILRVAKIQSIRDDALVAAPDMAEAGGEGLSTPRVFISYASQDASVAAALVERLEAEGIACWIAPRDVKAGAQYADAIVRAISSTRAFVLVLSESAIASSHVSKEVERASSKRRPIIALRIDAAPLTPALEYFLSESQWVDAQAGSMEPAYKKLIGAIRDFAQTQPAFVPASVHASINTASAKRARSRRILIAAGFVVVAVAAAVLFPDKFRRANHVTGEQQTSLISEKSVAVLPFTDMSEKKDQEYFGDGMAEDILDLLARIPDLRVIGRTSSFQFKGRNADLRTIGTELNAAHVLEGSVRRSGDQVRITAQLINTRTGEHEWSETYDRHIDDVLKLQDAIAAAVARELQLTVASEYLSSRATLKSADTYDLLLRGRHAVDRNDKEGIDEAVTLFKQALNDDPTSADAAAALALTYDVQGEFGYLAPTVAFEEARRLATTAVKLDPKTPLPHAVLAYVSITYDWDWAAAERECQLLSALAPGSSDALAVRALLSRTLGRWDDALRQIKVALVQNPLDPFSFVTLAKIQWSRGHLAEAEAAQRRVLEIRPTYEWAHFYLGVLLLARGNRDVALTEMQQETSENAQQEGLAMAYQALGRQADSDGVLARMLEQQADVNAFGIAEVYAYRGQSDDAVHWLERAYAQKDPSLYLIKVELPLKNLAGDAGFRAFLHKMNLPE